MRMDRLIQATHTRADAQTFQRHVVSENDKSVLAEVGATVLAAYKPVAGACTLLSAAYASLMHAATASPVHVVAGNLFADGVRVFGGDLPVTRRTFERSDLSWDGHAWVMLGNYVADISLCRTARSPACPAALSVLAAREFGPKTGLVILKSQDAALSGLRYSPRFVLPRNQVETLARSAQLALPRA